MAELSVVALLARLLEGTDEALNPVFDRVAEFFARYTTGNSRLLRKLIGKLGPTSLLAIKHAGPVVVSGAIGVLLPDSIFASPQRAATVKNVLVRFVTKVADAFEAGQSLNEANVDQVLRDVLDDMVIMYGGHYHDPECMVIPERTRSLYEDYARDGDPNKDRNRKYSALLRDMVTLARALETNKVPCGHCGHRTAAKAEASAVKPAPKPTRAPRSAADVIGMLEPNQRTEFNRWLSGLSVIDRQSALVGFAELDSVEEAIGFLALDPAVRLEMLPLLENRTVASQLKGAFKILSESAVKAGQWIGNGWNDGVAQADTALQPAADWLETRANAAAQPAPPPAPVGRWRKFGRALKSAAWFTIGIIVPVGRREEDA